MTNRPKAIGTAGETAVVRYLRDHGFYGAERRALAGAFDLGDITGCGPLTFEVKSGKTAEVASATQTAEIAQWLAETRTEARNAAADFGVLVCKRTAHGATRVGQWWAFMDSATFLALAGYPQRSLSDVPLSTVRMTLAEAVALLRHAGYGDEPDEVAA